MLDYSGYVFITSSYNGRTPLLISTLSNVMTRVKGAHFAIQWLEPEWPTYVASMIGMMADQTGNTFALSVLGETSVALSKRPDALAALPDPKFVATHFVNLDDDLLVTEKSLQVLLSLRSTPVVSIGVQDANNSRGFADYDTVKYESYAAFKAVHAPGKAKHHMFKHVSVISGYSCISQLWCLSIEAYIDPTIWGPVEQQFSVKGIRGYDILLEQLLAAKYPIELIVGCEALHMGLEHSYIGGPWTGAADITKQVVTLKESK